VVLLVLGLCGVYVIADGIGSVLIQGGQYHNVVVAWHLVG
jgi:hypothetical protein